jgi:hypothetical protein
MHAHEPCAPPVVPSTRAGPAAFGVHGGTSHKAPPARAFEGVGAVEAVRNDALWFGRVLGRCQGDGTSGHNDGCGCRPIVWWSVVAGQTGGGCSRSSARRFPRLRVRDAFFTSAAVQRVGARVNFAARTSTLPPLLWREETPAEDPWKAGCWRARPRWGEGTGCYACTSLGACGAGWVNLRVCVGAIAFLVPSSATSRPNVLANKWGRRAGGAASSAVAYPASPRRAPSKRGDRLEHRALPARRAGS